ncbi:Na+/H+ antiporter subunit D [Rhizobiaceae bacterium n13]|uniref:Na+/H+ antiporter subunit D n=1 Tax=Ferirhizobium litorale TaxID=2927786 RepID=A0AAE3QDN0_9HYPH|nr:Na+/H+ antiporter subunit D [Fererhizobium litorale]MDI7861294.1 Na+/H+ antiporter subunit D [Fererhizobium litorale]MDI7921441.1 Na+/H+ antiporter subunit D [Fererhizobium litorale]
MAAVSTKIADLSVAMVTAPVAISEWLVVLPVALCILLGATLMMIRDRISLHPLVAIPGLAAVVLVDAALLWKVVTEGPVTMVMGRWLPPFGIAFSVDILGAMLALAAAIVALAGSLYALSDINDSARRYGFFPFLLLLLAGVSGAFLTGDIFNLYVWFEVLLISSFGLLVLGSEREQIDGAVKYAFLNLVGTTLFLIAVGYLYAIFGTLNMADIAMKVKEGREGLPLVTLSALFLFAFGMKAAAFPVNFWLPASYHTPRVVVSAVFAGLLTKVGVYALIRVMVMLLPAEREELSLMIVVAAVATMLTGAAGALAQNDVRRLLGYLVISGIGSMLAGVALGGPGGISGAIFYALHSIVLMTALYMAAGLAARISGSYSLESLGGIYRQNAPLAFVTLALFFAVSGLPPFSGFWPKVILVKASLDIGAWWLAGVLLLTGFLTTIAVGRVFLLAYWRPKAGDDGAPAVSIDRTAFLPVLLLTALVSIFGVLPEGLLRLTQEAAAGLENPAAYVHSVFPGGAK